MKYKNNHKSMQETIYTLKDGRKLPLLTFDMLEKIPGIRHCFTTRQGGVSSGIFESLNLSFTRGDDQKAVRRNYEIVAEAMGTDLSHVVTSDQTHTVNVRKVTADDAGKGVIKPRDYQDVDGLITDVPGLLLATFYADCVPLYFVDPVHHAIGLSHSGWRGTAMGMGRVTCQRMYQEFHTRPEDLICAIGPSICQDCYEVSKDVADAFYLAYPVWAKDVLIDKQNGKYQLDLWETNRRILMDAGVLEEHIAVANICTCCNSSKLFSHRATGGKRGNLGAFLMLTEE